MLEALQDRYLSYCGSGKVIPVTLGRYWRYWGGGAYAIVCDGGPQSARLFAGAPESEGPAEGIRGLAYSAWAPHGGSRRVKHTVISGRTASSDLR